MRKITSGVKPAIVHGLRLQWEPAQEAHVLLYPEGMVKLNQSAAAILSRCDGVRTLGDIVGDLEQAYGATGLQSDVTAFMELALERSWVEMRP